jgi:hypothetical protein
MPKGDNSKGWPVKKPARGGPASGMPASGIPAGGPGLHGPAQHLPQAPQFTAKNQPAPEAKSEGKLTRQAFRDRLAAKLEKVEAVYDAALVDPDVRVGLVAAKQISVELWGQPAQGIGGSDELGPIRTVVAWEDEK